MAEQWWKAVWVGACMQRSRIHASPPKRNRRKLLMILEEADRYQRIFTAT